ncbi:MBL fold metallo-hydrolase [Thiomicrospira microaerophila]|uniref:MBL fold metallo-hydrolase n=1 Tax=Thiomicrospira microaerophila TaxID=406020 RepID=UPI00200DE627|nr:MBL fold metallo-hydrolase [Thiomicrospira microaerophila]UQB42997.1 MBL fold metallo-hydrolase [Thiomicrospira microaerophila]
MKRRDLFKTAIGLTAGFSVLRPLYAADDWEFRGPDVPNVPITKISDRTFYFLATDPEPSPSNFGFFSNPAFVVTSEGVVVIDTGGSVQIGEMLIRQIKTVTDKPVVAVFNTHIHGDHWLGNHAFVEAYPDVKLYAHPKVMEDVRNGAGVVWTGFMSRNTNNASAGTVITPPTLEVNEGDVIKVGDVQFKVHHMGKVHSDSDIAIEAVEEKVIFLGDMAMRRVANMADGNFKNSIVAMENFEAMSHIKYFVPGHGEFDDVSMIRDQKQFFEIIYNTIEEQYDNGLSDFEIRPMIVETEFMQTVAKEWPGFDSTIGRFVSEAYQEFEASLF